MNDPSPCCAHDLDIKVLAALRAAADISKSPQ